MADDAAKPPQPPQGERVNVLNPFGRLVSLPANEAAEAVASGGYSAATPEDVRLWKRSEEYGGIAGTAEALAGGAAEEATLGLSTKIAVELGGEEMRQRIQDVREENPTATTVGQVVGGVAGMGKLGAGVKGAKLLGRAAKGAGSVVRAPARLATKAGEGAAAIVRTVAPESKVFAAAAQGAVEGAFFGAGTEVSDSALEGRGISGEKLVAGMGYGAAVGGVFGGALAGTGKLLKAGGTKLKSAVVAGRETVGEAIGQRVTRGWQGTAGALGVENAESIGKFSPLTKAGREAVETAQKAPELMTEAAERAVDSAESAWSSMQKARARFSGGSKLEHVRRTIRRDNVAEQFAAHQKQLTNLRETLDELAGKNIKRPGRGASVAEKEAYTKATDAHRGTYGLPGKVRDARRAVLAAEAKLAKTKDAADAAFLMDELKRDIGNLTTGGKDPMDMRSLERATRTKFERSYRQFQQHLQREDLLGDFATLQGGMNKDWSGFLETQRVSQFGKKFTKRVPKRGGFGEMEEVIDRSKLLKALQPPKLTGGMADLAKIEEHEAAKAALREWSGDAQRFLNTGDEALGKHTSALAGDFRDSSGKLTGAMDELDRVSAIKNEWDAMGGGGMALPAAATGFAMGALGPAAAPLAAVGSALVDPKRAIRSLMSMERVAGAVGRQIGRAGPVLRRMHGVPRRAVTVTALDKREREKREGAIKTSLGVNVGALTTDTRDRYAQVFPGNPAIVRQMAATVERGAAYLQRVAPKPVQVPGQPPLPPADEDLERFDRQRQVVHSPIDTITAAVEKGTIIPEMVDALDSVYPDEAKELRDSYRQQLDDMATNGEALPYQATLALEVLMKEPLDYTSSRTFQRAMGKAAKPPKPKGPPRKPPELASNYDRDAEIMKALA